MKRALPAIVDNLHTLALTCWLFGLLVIVTLVAPVALRAAGLTSVQAGVLVGAALHRFGVISLVCGLVMVGTQFLTRRRYRRDRFLFIGDGVRQLLTFGALLVSEHGRENVAPALLAARAAGNAPQFDHLRDVLSVVAWIQILLLIGIGALTIWLQWPRPASVVAPATPAEPSKTPAAPPASRRGTQ